MKHILTIVLLIAVTAARAQSPNRVAARMVGVQTNAHITEEVLQPLLEDWGSRIGGIDTRLDETQVALALATINTNFLLVSQDLRNNYAYLLGGDSEQYVLTPSIQTNSLGTVFTNYIVTSTNTITYSADGSATNAALVPALQYNQDKTATNFMNVNVNTEATTNLFNIVGALLGVPGTTNEASYDAWVSAFRQMETNYAALPTNLVYNFPNLFTPVNTHIGIVTNWASGAPVAGWIDIGALNHNFEVTSNAFTVIETAVNEELTPTVNDNFGITVTNFVAGNILMGQISNHFSSVYSGISTGFEAIIDAMPNLAPGPLTLPAFTWNWQLYQFDTNYSVLADLPPLDLDFMPITNIFADIDTRFGLNHTSITNLDNNFTMLNEDMTLINANFSAVSNDLDTIVRPAINTNADVIAYNARAHNHNFTNALVNLLDSVFEGTGLFDEAARSYFLTNDFHAASTNVATIPSGVLGQYQSLTNWYFNRFEDTIQPWGSNTFYAKQDEDINILIPPGSTADLYTLIGALPTYVMREGAAVNIIFEDGTHEMGTIVGISNLLEPFVGAGRINIRGTNAAVLTFPNSGFKLESSDRTIRLTDMVITNTSPASNAGTGVNAESGHIVITNVVLAGFRRGLRAASGGRITLAGAGNEVTAGGRALAAESGGTIHQSGGTLQLAAITNSTTDYANEGLVVADGGRAVFSGAVTINTANLAYRAGAITFAGGTVLLPTSSSVLGTAAANSFEASTGLIRFEGTNFARGITANLGGAFLRPENRSTDTYPANSYDVSAASFAVIQFPTNNVGTNNISFSPSINDLGGPVNHRAGTILVTP